MAWPPAPGFDPIKLFAVRADDGCMISAPSDHVRGDLLAPAIDWLGQLVVERRRPLKSLDPLLPGGERALLNAPPSARDWVPVHAGRRIVEALVEVHGGCMSAVLRELGRRSVPRVAALDGTPDDRLAIRLEGLVRLGHWRRARPLLPGDLLELEAHQACAPSLLDWISGLVAGATPKGRRGGSQIVVRSESPRRFVFVRCAT